MQYPQIKFIEKFTIYQYMVVFLSVFVIYSSFMLGFKVLLRVIVAVIITVIIELSFYYVKNKSFYFPYTAIITGLFVGGILTDETPYYIVVLAALIALLSKKIVRFQNRPLFNPAIFGILMVALFFNAFHIWWAYSWIYLAIIFGIIIAYRFRRFHLPLTVLISYYILNFIIISKLNIEKFSSSINNPVLIFFAFFMVMDPKTSPLTTKGRVIFGVLIGIFYVGYNFIIPQHDILLSLVTANVFVPVLNRYAK